MKKEQDIFKLRPWHMSNCTTLTYNLLGHHSDRRSAIRPKCARNKKKRTKKKRSVYFISIGNHQQSRSLRIWLPLNWKLHNGWGEGWPWGYMRNAYIYIWLFAFHISLRAPAPPPLLFPALFLSNEKWDIFGITSNATSQHVPHFKWISRHILNINLIEWRRHSQRWAGGG